MNSKTTKWNNVTIFFFGVLLYLLAVLPFLIYRGGIFFYYGDYNVQQVPFYILAHRAVRSGHIFWNSMIDLGSNTGGAFAMYLWGSPFFWVTIPFPESVLPYLLPILMSLKYGTALLSAYLWIKSQLPTSNARGYAADALLSKYPASSQYAALIGALLYAFSGFQSTNIVFQHFHDVTAFFPFYLLIFDKFVQNRRKGISFALMTAFMCMLNYFFFFGQVIFLILYYFARYVIGSKTTVRDVLRSLARILAHGILGLGLCAVFIVQVLDILLGNTRLSNTLSGYDTLAYSESTIPLAIVRSLFMANDLVGRGTLFAEGQIKNASLAAYLPGFALLGVIAFWITRRRSWIKRVLTICIVFAFVPILNSLFAALNTQYYARWFYMPILMMALMTAGILQEADFIFFLAEQTKYDAGQNTGYLRKLSVKYRTALRRGYIIALIVPFMFALVSLLPGSSKSGTSSFGTLLAFPHMFLIEILATYLCLILIGILFHHGRLTGRLALLVTASCCFLTTFSALASGNTIISRIGGEKWRAQMLQNKPLLANMDDSTEQFFRIETDATSTNYEMVWGYPTIHCFESTVSPSIFDFYTGIGITRTVESKMDFSHVGARAILSQRYYLENISIEQDDKDRYDGKGGLSGFRAVNESDGFQVYLNDHYIPMGFVFDEFITEQEYASITSKKAKDRALARFLIVSKDTPSSFTDLLTHAEISSDFTLSEEEFWKECDARAASSCKTFTFDPKGFTASTSNLAKESLLFISVPYEKGFTAYVDGVKTEILRADFGLMTIRVPAGVHDIRFTYLPYGFRVASCISLLSVLALFVLCRRNGKVHKNT